MAAAFARRPCHKRDELAVQSGLANEQTRRDRHAHPAVFQDVNSESGATCGYFALPTDAQVVVDARQRRVHGRRGRFALRGKSSRAKRAVLVHTDHNPSNRARPRLRRETRRKCENCGQCKSTEAETSAAFETQKTK